MYAVYLGTFWKAAKYMSIVRIIQFTEDNWFFMGCEFDYDIGAHNCRGRGKNNHCLWVRDIDLLPIKDIGGLDV